MPLRWAAQAVRPMQSGRKPLWAIRRSGLVDDHVQHLFVENLGITLRRKIAVLLPPGAPAARHTVRYLLDAGFAAGDPLPIFIQQRLAPLILQRYACFPEIFLRQDVRGYGRPE